MKSIYIGVCSTREDPKFKESYRNFTDSIYTHYSICLMTLKNQFLPDAQNSIAKSFLQNDYDYLLLLDDDHWGHTREMLETLIKADAYMATIKSYSRHYPYSCTLMKKIEKGYAGIENCEGYMDCDLTGFPMTLIKKETFDFLEYPYFRPTEGDSRTWATDKDFCERLNEKGIKPVGCFQHCLPHADITEENVFTRRHTERFYNNNIAQYNLFNRRQTLIKMKKILQGV